jgi:HSP20 family protein
VLMRTDPFRDFDRLFQQATSAAALPAAMPIDAYRKGDEFVIHFDLPGITADALDLSVEKNVLTLKAERKRAENGGEWIVRERPHGTFTRSIFLGDSLDTDSLEASYADGVLTVRLPVAEKAKPRRIEVTTGASTQTAIETHSVESTEPDLVGAAANN